MMGRRDTDNEHNSSSAYVLKLDTWWSSTYPFWYVQDTLPEFAHWVEPFILQNPIMTVNIAPARQFQQPGPMTSG